MRAMMLVTALLIAGCAGQPSNPQAAANSGRLATSEAGRLALARNLNLKVVDKDGQQLFCRSNFMTGSHIERDTTCYTADELDKLEAKQQRDLDQLERNSSAGGIRSP
jgi:hypothetical protein